MLLAVDVGNTQTVLGLYDGDAHGRLAPRDRALEDGRRARRAAGGMLDLEAVDGICLSSTVPALMREWERLAVRWAEAPLLVVGPGVKTGDPDPLRRPARGRAGPDRQRRRGEGALRRARASSSTSGRRRTSTSSRPQGEYVGGVLAPGIEISMDALFARAARLVKVDYVAPPSVIGKTTVGGLQSGVVYGFAGQVDGIVAADPRRARRRGAGRRDRRARGARRAALEHDRPRRPVPHARRACGIVWELNA